MGIFIRSLIGLDRQEAKRVFNDFLDGKRFNSNQIEFVNLIIDYLTKNGVMDAGLLFQSPYTNFDAMGVIGIFPEKEAKQILGILQEIRYNAAA